MWLEAYVVVITLIVTAAVLFFRVRRPLAKEEHSTSSQVSLSSQSDSERSFPIHHLIRKPLLVDVYQEFNVFLNVFF